MEFGEKFAVISNYFLMILSLVTGIILIMLMVNVYKKLGTKDNILLGMLSCLCCSCLTTVLYFCTQIYRNAFKEDPGYVPPDPVPDFDMDVRDCFVYVVSGLPGVFLFMAVMLNINKWMYFRWRIQSLTV